MVKKYVKIDPRVAKQDAKSAVRDPIDALIELITNSMDSYNRMKGRGETLSKTVSDKADIYLFRKTKGKERKAIIATKDWAEGIAPDKMEEYISGYGARTSGKETFQSIRGYFGRGLKDAAGGLDGIGTINSLKNGTISTGIIDGTEKNSIRYETVKTCKATMSNLKKFHLDDNAKTIAMVEFSNENVSMPKFDKFAEKLALCMHLRPLMEKGNISLIQMDRGKIIKERPLKYNKPRHSIVHLENNCTIKGESVIYNIVIRKAEEELTQGEAGKFREGGLLIMSGTSVHEATLLKYERNPNAGKFFGEVRCDHIDQLMREDESVVTPDRKGLNWDHAFLKKLKKEIEQKLSSYIKEEEKERDKKKKGISKSALERNTKMGSKLGKLYREIMSKEGTGLEDIWGEGDGEKEGILKPPNGFGFNPSFYPLELKKKKQLRLVIDCPKIIPSHAKILIESDNNEIVTEKKHYLVTDGNYREEENVYILPIEIMGKKIGARGIVKAKTKSKAEEELIAEAIIEVRESDEYPPNGFGFIPNKYRIKVNKTKKIVLRVDSDIIQSKGMEVEIKSDNEYIIPETTIITFDDSDNGVIEKKISVRGTKSGEKGTISAEDIENRGRRSEANVKVISTERKKGFEIEYDEREKPTQRSTYSKEEGVIYIFVKEPTVERYFGNGEYCDNLSFLVLCADLITDAFCSRVVEDLNEQDKIQTLGEDIETAIKRKLNELKRRYGPTIHSSYVDSKLLGIERNP